MTCVADTSPTWRFLPGTLCDARVFGPLLDVPDAAVRIFDRLDSPLIGALADQAVEGMAPRFNVVGFSLGCQISLEIMRRYPERFRGLVLISTTTRADQPEMVPVRRRMVTEFDRLGPREFVETTLWPSYVANPQVAAPQI